MDKSKLEGVIAAYKLLGKYNVLIDKMCEHFRYGLDIFVITDYTYHVYPKYVWEDAVNFVRRAGGSEFLYVASEDSCHGNLFLWLQVPGIKVLGYEFQEKDTLVYGARLWGVRLGV